MIPFGLRLCAALMTAVMAVSLGPCPQVLAAKKKFSPEAASYTSYELVTFDGGTIKLGIDGTSFVVDTEAASIFEITLCTADDNNIVRRFKRQSGRFSIDSGKVAVALSEGTRWNFQVEKSGSLSLLTGAGTVYEDENGVRVDLIRILNLPSQKKTEQ